MDDVKTNEELYKLINENEMLLVYFGSSSCGVCHAMKPKIDRLLEKYPEIRGARIETSSSVELSASYSVFIVPVIILFIQGKETIKKARIIDMEVLEQEISRYYKLFYEIN